MTSLVERTCVGQMASGKRPIISVPDTASVHTALQIMLNNNVVALPVAAPPGKWLGAGQSVIIDNDKQYIGMVSMTDVAIHLAAFDCAPTAVKRGVIDIIGNSPEGLSMWVYDAATRLVDVMEPMSKGVHRVLVRCTPTSAPSEPEPAATRPSLPSVQPPGVPQDSPSTSTGPGSMAPEASSPLSPRPPAPSNYAFLSQSDVVRFLSSHIDDLGMVVHRSLTDLSLVDALFPPLAVSESASVLSALQLMRRAPAVTAVAVVADEAPALSEDAPLVEEATEKLLKGDGGKRVDTLSSSSQQQHTAGTPLGEASSSGESTPRWVEARWRRGGRILGTLSVTDLRGLTAKELQQLGSTTVRKFLTDKGGVSGRPRPPVACRPDAQLSLAMALAVANGIHRVWVTTEDDELVGVVSLSDLLAALRRL